MNETAATEQLSQRESQIRAFLKKHGYGEANRSKIPGDASFRHYERITMRDQKFILMDAPPPKEDVKPFVAIDKYLVAQGFSAPKILAEDATLGFLLLEDLGNDSYTKVLKSQKAKEKELYSLAVEALAKLHTKPLPNDIKPYDKDKLMQEACLLPEWYYKLAHKTAIPEKTMKEYRGLWEALIPEMITASPVTVLRDYHADNLMWLPKREGIARVGMLDFQDALAGHPAYDLVSLLEDARRDVPRPLADEMISLYMELMPKMSAEQFRTSYALLGAQRNCKILGIFARLYLRDGKVNYLPYLPRVWHHVEHDVTHPKLAALSQWLDTLFPQVERRNVPVIEDA